MAAFHYQRPRIPGEREVDAAFARAEAGCDVMERRLTALDADVAATRQIAQTAGIFKDWPEFTTAAAPERRAKRTRRLALRTALARAVLRGI